MNDQYSSGIARSGPSATDESDLGSGSQPSGSLGPSAPESGSDSGAMSTAQDEAKHLKDTTTQSVSEVAGTAIDQAQQVTADVKDQARKLADDAKSQVQEQATSQRDRAVESLRSFGNELGSLAHSSNEDTSSGLATQLAREGSSYSHQVADFLEQREPGDLLDEVRDFARRRPGTFLVGAAVAGVVVGRLTRGAVAAKKEGEPPTSASSGHATSTTTAGATPSTTPPVTRSAIAAVDGELPGGPATRPTPTLPASGVPGQAGGTL